MKTLAIIPARGGSEGIPGKNLTDLRGRPLVAWIISAALKSRAVDRVVVSSDDEEILTVAKAHGAETIKRPPEISTGTASSESALLHALEALSESENYSPDILVFLQCTSPFTTGEDIDRAVETLIREEADSALSVTASHAFLWKRDDKGEAVAVNHEKTNRPMRQQLPPEFRETGAIYVMRAEGFVKARHRFFGHTVLVETPPERSMDIDEPFDLEIAGLMAQRLGLGQG